MRKPDVTIAKKYLTEDELKALNLIVSAYLDFAELQATSRRPMHMRDWITKLVDSRSRSIYTSRTPSTK